MEGLFQQWFRSGIIDTLEVIALFLEVGQAKLSIFITDEQVSEGPEAFGRGRAAA